MVAQICLAPRDRTLGPNSQVFGDPRYSPTVFYRLRALYRVRFASLFSRARSPRGTPEEKPITVDRPNRTYVLYPASGMKFDETCETRDEARARALNRTMCSIGRRQQKRTTMELEPVPLGVRTKRVASKAEMPLNDPNIS